MELLLPTRGAMQRGKVELLLPTRGAMPRGKVELLLPTSGGSIMTRSHKSHEGQLNESARTGTNRSVRNTRPSQPDVQNVATEEGSPETREIMSIRQQPDRHPSSRSEPKHNEAAIASTPTTSTPYTPT